MPLSSILGGGGHGGRLWWPGQPWPTALHASQDFAVSGEQLLYQIPNNKLLTTKIGLLSALREYSRVVNKIHKTSLCAQAK